MELTLQKVDSLAHDLSEVPQQCDWLGDLHGHAEQSHQQVCYRQVHQEYVCDAETKEKSFNIWPSNGETPKL